MQELLYQRDGRRVWMSGSLDLAGELEQLGSQGCYPVGQYRTGVKAGGWLGWRGRAAQTLGEGATVAAANESSRPCELPRAAAQTQGR